MRERATLQQRIEEIDREAKDLIKQVLPSHPGLFEQLPNGKWRNGESNILEFGKND
jgi:hypothetical protein